MNTATRSLRLAHLPAVSVMGLLACWLAPAGAAGGVILSPTAAATNAEGDTLNASTQRVSNSERPALPFDPAVATSEAWHPSATVEGHWFEVRPANDESNGLPALAVRTASDPSSLEAPPPLASPAAPLWAARTHDGDLASRPLAEPAPAAVPLPPALFTGLGAAIGCGAVGWLHRRLSRPSRWRYA